MAKNHIDRPMKMLVYNSRTDQRRDVTITPSRAWGGKTLLGTTLVIYALSNNTALGASIRYCQVTNAIDRVWHVVEVIPNSPASVAGLIPQKGATSSTFYETLDWIIGSPEIALNNPEDFYHLMTQNQKRPVRLFVFNIDMESIRDATVIPDFQWGGEGCLGCDVASGALHRIPSANSSKNEPEQPLLAMHYEETLTSPTEQSKPLNQMQQPFQETLLQPAAPVITQDNLADDHADNRVDDHADNRADYPSHHIPESSKQEHVLQPIPGFGDGEDAGSSSFLQ